MLNWHLSIIHSRLTFPKANRNTMGFCLYTGLRYNTEAQIYKNTKNPPSILPNTKTKQQQQQTTRSNKKPSQILPWELCIRSGGTWQTKITRLGAMSSLQSKRQHYTLRKEDQLKSQAIKYTKDWNCYEAHTFHTDLTMKDNCYLIK